MEIDPRTFTSAFEVHYWPHLGRIVMVHVSAGTGYVPVLTEIMILNQSGAQLGDTTALTAFVLADAGDPIGGVVEHTWDGKTRVNREEPAPVTY
jgi:hypothetical protein